MPLLIKNGLVLPSAHSEPRTVDILVDGALISNIGRDLYAPEGVRVIDAEGHLVIPGLINAHTHGREKSFEGAYRQQAFGAVAVATRCVDRRT